MGGEIVIGLSVGFILGVSVWFPWSWYFKRLVNKKREATSLLQELSMTEQEHLQSQPYSGHYQAGWTQTPNTWTTTGTDGANTVAPPSYTQTATAKVLQEYYDNLKAYSRAVMGSVPQSKKNPTDPGTP